MLEVSYTGMDAETRPRIFEPFYTTKATGTGISTTFGLVKPRCGRVDAERGSGKETTFRICSPAA